METVDISAGIKEVTITFESHEPPNQTSNRVNQMLTIASLLNCRVSALVNPGVSVTVHPTTPRQKSDDGQDRSNLVMDHIESDRTYQQLDPKDINYRRSYFVSALSGGLSGIAEAFIAQSPTIYIDLSEPFEKHGIGQSEFRFGMRFAALMNLFIAQEGQDAATFENLLYKCVELAAGKYRNSLNIDAALHYLTKVWREGEQLQNAIDNLNRSGELIGDDKPYHLDNRPN